MSRSGPFEIVSPEQPPVPRGIAASDSSQNVVHLCQPALQPSLQSIERDFDCGNYTTCLGLAAALNWDSFTCAQCSREVNAHLLWRAHHECRKDAILSDICRLPRIVPAISRPMLSETAEDADAQTTRRLRSS